GEQIGVERAGKSRTRIDRDERCRLRRPGRLRPTPPGGRGVQPRHQALLPRMRRRTGPGRLGRQRRVGVTNWTDRSVITVARTRKLITLLGQKRSRKGSTTGATAMSLTAPPFAMTTPFWSLTTQRTPLVSLGSTPL